MMARGSGVAVDAKQPSGWKGRLLDDGRAIYLVVALFVLLGTLYSVTTPIFEAGDELWHYPHVQWLALGNGLPVQDPTLHQLWEQEGGQPPLYYALAAASTFWIDTGDMQARLWRNPYARIGIPLAFGNKNMVVHTGAESFPWQHTTLAVHLIRFLSVLFSAGTVFLTYKLSREILAHRSPRDGTPDAAPIDARRDVSASELYSPKRLYRGIHLLPVLAASIVAFNPMFLFISASVNNDSLAALLATSAVLLCVQLVTRGATNRRSVLLGVIIGLGIMTKVSNVSLAIVAILVLVYLWWRDKKFTTFLRSALLVGLPILVIAGWWFARNYFLYGDSLAFNVWLQIAGGRAPQTLLGLLSEFQGFRISFWGNFGGVNVIAPEWVYTVLDIFTVLAVVGLILGVVRRTLPFLLWIPALQLAVVFAALVRWTLLTYASQGRLIFPAIAAVAILMAFGLYELTKSISQIANRILPKADGESPISNLQFPSALPAALVIFLFCLALAAPFLIIAPVYALPARVQDAAQVPNPVHITYNVPGGQPELVGFETTRFLAPGQELPLKLFWRTDAPVTDDLAMYVHVYDTHGERIGQWDAYPGNGLYPPLLWQPGEIFVDEYRVPVNPPDSYPPIGRIEVGMTRPGSSRVLPAHNPQGETITPSLARFKFSRSARLRSDPLLSLGDQFNLINFGLLAQRGNEQFTPDLNSKLVVPLKPGDVLNLGATMQALRIPNGDYTLFAHVVDANGKIVAQQDAQPLDNTYPTSLWNENEEVGSLLTLDIPLDALGVHTLEFGVYNAQTLERLPILGDDYGFWRVQGDHLSAPLEIAP